MQTSSFVLNLLTAFLVYISLVFLFLCFLLNHLSLAISVFLYSCLNAVLQIACSWSSTLTVFSCDKSFTLSLLWQILVRLKFLLEEPLWPEPNWVTILTFSHPSIVEKHHCLASSLQNHCAQEISSWSSFPSFSFKLFKRTYESASRLVVYHHLPTHL